MEYDKLCEIDSDIERMSDHLYEIKGLLTEIRDLLRLIVRPSTPVDPAVSLEGAAWAMEDAHHA